MRFIDPDGRDEFEFKYGEWVRVSNIGGSIGIDFYHMGITNVTDRQGNWIEMSDGRKILADGKIRSDETNPATIYNEFIEGLGPVTSIFEGDHHANTSIQGHYLYQEVISNFISSNKDKAYYEVDWGFFDVFRTEVSNIQAQIMRSYGASFYKLGDRILNIMTDSKSRTSLYYHSSYIHNYERGQLIYNPWIGGWQRAPNWEGNTYQIYMFFSE